MPAFLDSLDIANRACQHLGIDTIQSVTEDSRQNRELSNVYQKALDAELKRNDWRFAMKRTALRALTTTTMLLQPALWNASLLYLPGSVVADANGDLWFSVQPENVGNAPGTSQAWDQYFGPMTADLYASTTSYYAGELVYKLVGNPGSYVAFISLQNGNTEDPGVADAWSATTTYGQNAVVSYLGSQWRSLIDLNLNVTPAVAPLAYQPAATYSTAQTVTASDGYIYSSVGNGNIGNDPTLDGGVHWTNTNVAAAWSNNPGIYPTSTLWAPLFASLGTIFLLYPIGAGPQEQISSRNMYHLPANYLKQAPQDPKAGSTNYLGSSHAAAYTDWEYTGDYIVSGYSNVIPFRFVARVANVQEMDPMFCEGLACRLALETAQALTQSAGKFQQVGSSYKLAITEARMINAIEQGPIEPEEDDFVTARL